MNPDRIFDLACGFMAAKLLFAAADVGLFEQLANGPATADDLATRIDVPLKSVRLVADAMVALGMLTVDGGRYQNTEEAQTFLTGSASDVRPMLALFDRMTYPAWTAFSDAVRLGGGTPTGADLSREEQAIFSAGVESVTKPGAAALATTYDFLPHQRLLDLGGGTGSFLKAIRRIYPRLETTLFDRPSTIEFARARFIADEPQQIHIIQGDMLRGPLPSDYDVMLLAHILHLFNEETNIELLERAYDAAPEEGRLLLVDFFLDRSRTEPRLGAVMSADFFLRTSGRSYSAEEVRGWLEQTGWRVVEERPLAGAVGLIVGGK